MSYNGKEFEYDKLGNPILYKDMAMEFGQGRRLNKFSNIAMYEYNSKGIRTKKIINTDIKNSEWQGNDAKTYSINYYLIDNKIISQIDASNVMNFYYGVDGVVGFNLNDKEYTYIKNIQGDIIGIIDENDELIAKYTYDAWGNHSIQYLNALNKFVDIEEDYSYNDITNTNRFVAYKNPFRYRSYYFDYETGLYYLNSRYYDPETGRFINADDISTLDFTQSTINGLNLYAYCLNNPVNTFDDNGNMPNWLKWLLGIGAGIVAVAATILTLGAAGIAIGGIAGAIIQGAAAGALIGAAIGTIGGGIVGGIYSAITGSDFWISVAYGMIAGFGIGAIAGAIIGGTIGGLQYGSFTSSKLLNSHFQKHGKEFEGLFATVKDYAKGAKYVIKNGTYIPQLNGYIKFFGAGGNANYAFVGLTRNGFRITTFGIRSVASLIKSGIPWLLM